MPRSACFSGLVLARLHADRERSSKTRASMAMLMSNNLRKGTDLDSLLPSCSFTEELRFTMDRKWQLH